MAGGFTAWKRAGLKFERPFVMTQEQTLRYARHTMLPEVGEEGQVKLLKSKVLCLGAGGLGSPSGLYLAAAGVGTLGFVDDDTVDASNLQRQILHATDRVGMPKVLSAAAAIAKLNPDVKVNPYQERLTSENVLKIIKDYDVIVDGADNFPSRYLLNDAALKLGKPVIHASIYRFEGQVTTFLPDQGPCYRCLYPSPPPPDMAPSCQEAGVLGVLCGVIGSLQTTEAIKLILGIGKSLSGRLLMFDALEHEVPRDEAAPRSRLPDLTGDGVDPSKIELIDYEAVLQRRELGLCPPRDLPSRTAPEARPATSRGTLRSGSTASGTAISTSPPASRCWTRASAPIWPRATRRWRRASRATATAQPCRRPTNRRC